MSAATADEPTVITQPGVVLGMPHETYLADPVQGGSLSHSGIKTLVTKTAALFDYERTHGRPNKKSFDLGHAAHHEVLGVGPEIVVVQKTAKDGTKADAGDYATKSAQDHRDAIYAAGAVPVLREQVDAVREMADSVRRHPLAAKLLASGMGEPEASAFTRDPETGVWLRCRYDYLRRPGSNGRLLLVDFKTADDASEDAFSRSAKSFGYHVQSHFYSWMARLLGLANDVAFLFVVIETKPPYLVNVIELDVTARRIGQLLTRQGIETYRRCTETGVWPGYPSEEPARVSLPVWYERQYEDQLT